MEVCDYSQSTYGVGEYNGTNCLAMTSSQSGGAAGTLTDTGSAILLGVGLACCIISFAVVVSFKKHKPYRNGMIRGQKV